MGTEEFWVPAVIAAVGAATSAGTQMAATSRANNTELQNLQEQQNIRQKAAGAVNKEIQNVSQQQTQGDQQRKATSAYVQQLRANEAANNPTTNGAPNVPGASSRYAADNASNGAAVNSYANAQAQNLGTITGLTNQRQQIGQSMGSLGTQLGLYGAQSGATGFVNQLRAQAAGQASPWGTLAGNLLTNAGGTLSKNPDLIPGTAGYGLSPITSLQSKMIN